MEGGKRSGILCAGMLLLLFLGLIYAYSVLLAPLKAEFAWPVSGMTLIFALSICAFTLGGLLSGQIVRSGRIRAGLLLGAGLLLAGFLGISMVPAEGSLAFAATMYGVVASFGIGAVYNIVIPMVSAWFPDKPGFAQGLCLMGFGMGGFLLGPLVTSLYACLAWRRVMVGVGAVFAALIVASSLLIRAPRLDEIGLPEPASDMPSGKGETRGSLRMMLSSPIFYLELLFLFFMGSSGMGITGIGRELPLALGVGDMAASFIIGFVNIGSGIGRFGGGVLLDRVGCERSMVGIAVVGIVSPIVVALSLAAGSVSLQVLGCLLFGVSWGAAIVTMPFITRREWGQEGLAQNMAVVNTYSILGAIAGSFGAGMLAELTNSYYPVLAIMVAFAVLALAVAWRMLGLRKLALPHAR